MNDRWLKYDMEFLGGRRQRRLRRSGWMRDMVRETTLTPHDFIWPLFIIDGQNETTQIRTMPGVERLSLLAGVLNVNLVWLLHGVGDAPADEIGPDPLAAITVQLERLKRMHDDTGRIIERIQRELTRLEEER